VVSTPSAPPPSAAPDLETTVSRLKEALLPEIRQLVERQGQSLKDRRIAGIERDLQTLKQYLDGSGGDINRAARELAIDELLSQGAEQTANQGKVGEDWQAGVLKILEEAEKTAGVKISLDDPELVAAARGQYASWAEAYAAVNRVVLRRAKGVPAGVVPTEVSGTSPTSKSVEELTVQLDKLYRTGGSMEQIHALKKQLLEATAT